jgi:hypothetical protein
LDETTHKLVSAHYSSKSFIDPTKTVRDWLNGKSFDEQYEYGINYLREIGVMIP